jgi:HEAT repeat protein
MSFLHRFRKYILAFLIASTAGVIALGACVLWPQFQIFSLIQQLRNPDVDVRRRAAEKLGEFGSVASEAVPSLALAMEDEDLVVRSNAAFSICSIDRASDIAAPVLLESLYFCKPFDGFGGCRGPSIMENVATALKGMGSKALPHLANALNDDCSNVRFWACFCYGELGYDANGHDEPLLMAMNDEDNLVRVGAAISTWKLRQEAGLTLPVVKVVLSDRDPHVQRATSALLSVLGREALPVLLEQLEAADSWTRMVAAMRIGGLREGARDAAPALVLAARDEDSGVREAALFALRCIPADSSLTLQSLITALIDDIDAVRECAARGLGELRAEAASATDALTKASTDRAHRVREAALAALESIRRTPGLSRDTLEVVSKALA